MKLGHLLGGRDRFEIEQRVATGGMGEIFRARDRETGEPVAVKIISDMREHRAARGASRMSVDRRRFLTISAASLSGALLSACNKNPERAQKLLALAERGNQRVVVGIGSPRRCRHVRLPVRCCCQRTGSRT